MFSSWDLVRPRYWYPMSSLEQSMMELEHMSDLMTRSHSPFDMGGEMLAAPTNLDDDDFFQDLPTLVQTESDTQTQTQHKTQPKTTSPARGNDPNKTKHTSMTKQQQPRPLDQADANVDADNQYHRTFSSYSFSDSSFMDDKGQRVASTRRRYEDSTGRLKAVHERQIEGKKLRTMWNRMGPDDEGQHESVCSSGSPEEFEALWQQTPFGEKKTVKEQQQQQLEQSQLQSPTTSESNSKSTVAGTEAK